MKNKPNLFTSFYRYNIVAAIATSVDFAALVLLTELFEVWYMFSAFTGALAGGVTAFVLERNWTFMKQDGKLSVQAVKYVAMWITSLLLNISGLFLVVEYLGFDYITAKVIVAILVGIGFNFLTHKFFIFN